MLCKGRKNSEGRERERQGEEEEKKREKKRKTRARNESRGLVPLDLYLRRRIEINEMSCFLLPVYLCIMHLCPLPLSYACETPYFRGYRVQWDWGTGFEPGLIRGSELRCHTETRGIFMVSWHVSNFRGMEKEGMETARRCSNYSRSFFSLGRIGYLKRVVTCYYVILENVIRLFF